VTSSSSARRYFHKLLFLAMKSRLARIPSISSSAIYIIYRSYIGSEALVAGVTRAARFADEAGYVIKGAASRGVEAKGKDRRTPAARHGAHLRHPRRRAVPRAGPGRSFSAQTNALITRALKTLESMLPSAPSSPSAMK
jgi:hypothetical protein